MNKYLIIFLILFSNEVSAQQIEMAETMRSEGKIYVVVAVLFIIFTVLITYLITIERKLTRLEKKLKAEE